MECHSKWNVTQNVMSFKIECHSKYNVTQMECRKNGMSLNLKCDSKLNINLKRNVTQWNFTKIECH